MGVRAREAPGPPRVGVRAHGKGVSADARCRNSRRGSQRRTPAYWSRSQAGSSFVRRSPSRASPPGRRQCCARPPDIPKAVRVPRDAGINKSRPARGSVVTSRARGGASSGRGLVWACALGGASSGWGLFWAGPVLWAGPPLGGACALGGVYNYFTPHARAARFPRVGTGPQLSCVRAFGGACASSAPDLSCPALGTRVKDSPQILCPSAVSLARVRGSPGRGTRALGRLPAFTEADVCVPGLPLSTGDYFTYKPFKSAVCTLVAALGHTAGRTVRGHTQNTVTPTTADERRGVAESSPRV